MSVPAGALARETLPDWIEAAAAPRRDEPAWLAHRRVEALDAFRAAGFPSRRDEAWKYTSLRPIERRSFAADTARRPARQPAGIEGLDGPAVVFVNGRLAGTLPDCDGMARLLADAIRDGSEAAQTLLGRVAAPERHRFAALGLAAFDDGLLLDLPAGAELAGPLRIVFVADGSQGPALACPRVVVRAGANSRATLVEHYLSEGEALSLATTEVVLGEGSRLVHYRLQEEAPESWHLGVLSARLGRDASLVSHTLAVGAKLARLDLDVRLEQPGAAVELNGLFLGAGRQHLDNHTCVEHVGRATRSDEIYRGVLCDQAHGVFNGRAIVREGADGTDARQSNANLLLSPGAGVDTKPELEIYTDDVKCSHGATTGQLDAEALFYLRSRGLDEDTARSVLTFAFADTVLARMGLEPVRRHAEQLVTGRLPDSERLREFT